MTPSFSPSTLVDRKRHPGQVSVGSQIKGVGVHSAIGPRDQTLKGQPREEVVYRWAPSWKEGGEGVKLSVSGQAYPAASIHKGG